MDELGSLLREAREAKGLTLAEAQEATRINSNYLEALEEGQYGLLPTEVHVRGYLRNYAKYLDLEPKPLLDRYELNRDSFSIRTESLSGSEVSDYNPIPSKEGRVFYDPVNMELSGSERSNSGSALRIVIILALIASIALIANRFIPLLTGNGDESQNISTSLEDAVSSITNSQDQLPQSTPTPDTAIIPGANDPITSTSRNSAIQLPTPAPTRPTLPAILESIRLRLEVTERTWMRVTIDDEVVFEGLARKGDGPFEWEASNQAQLLTGNAVGIFVTINDIELGRLGGRGEVVEETWTTTGGG